MSLSAREGFIAWYSAFTMAHSVLGFEQADMDQDFLTMYDSIIDTVWQSMYPTLTREEIDEIRDDINLELMKARTVLEEANALNKFGEKV